MNDNDIAISVRNLTKTYRLFRSPMDRIKHALTLGQGKFHDEYTALRDVSFDIQKGETVGIIGRNGSGKSTLLQLICGILKPTAGSVQANGRISALLELGAGFNPEFTGRENVYFQGTLTGFTREQMDVRFDEIAAFADIGEFIDQPVRTYSSGMFVRLAFAAAVHIEPDILVVDEALAVGDREFQIKCLEHIDGIARKGGTVVIVSHSLEQVAHHCDSAIFLDRGKLICAGGTTSVLAAYLHDAKEHISPEAPPTEDEGKNTSEEFDLLAKHPWYSLNETRWGDGKASIQGVRILQESAEPKNHIEQSRPTTIEFDILFLEPVNNPIFGLTIKSTNGGILYSINSRQLGNQTYSCQAGTRVCAAFKLIPCLDSGNYLLSLGVASDSQQGLQAHDRRYDVLNLRIQPPRQQSGELDMRAAFLLEISA